MFKHHESLLCVKKKKEKKKKDEGRIVVINWELHNLNLMSWAAILKFRCHSLPGMKLVNKGEKDSTGSETERKKMQERDRAS